MKTIILTVLSFCFSLTVFGQSKFSKQEVIEDLGFLWASLEDAHYNLYAYTPKSTFDSVYKELKNSIVSDSLSLLEATKLFQQLASTAKNGHTSIDFPVQPYIAYAQSGGTVFPLEIAFENDKALIRKNWSANDSIKIGSEILSINGNAISEVLSKIHLQISAERPYFSNTKLELFSFPRYYWLVFGQQGTFKVEIRSAKATKEYQLEPVSAISGYEQKRDEIMNPAMKMEFISDSIAYLNPGGFGGDEEKYRAFIDSSFMEIKKATTQNLVIDLRNNPGGNDAFSDYLVSYIADKPFKWNSSFTLKTSKFLKEYVREHYDTTEMYWQQVITHKDGEIYDYPFEEYQPQEVEKRFKGKVYVLINRQSHSQSAVTAGQIQDYHFGTIVGEETGDSPSLYASIFQFPLPNTKVSVHVSKGYMVRVNGSKKEEGVVPDISIKDHLLDENDEILNGLLKMIRQKD